MKKLKKLFAVMLSLIMVLAMGITSFAATGVTPTENDAKEVTISNVETDAKITAYQIIDAQYNANGFVGYVWATGMTNAGQTVSDPAAAVTSDLVTTLARNTTGLTKIDNVVSGQTKLPVGTWMLLVTPPANNPAKVYNPMVVSVYYSESGSDSEMAAGSVDANSNWTLVTTNAYAKSSEIEVTKTVDTADEKAAVGTDVHFTITGTIPSYSGEYTEATYALTDTLVNGLTFGDPATAPVAPVVKVGGSVVGEEAYELVNVTATTFKVNFKSNYILGLAGKSATERAVEITYTAKVTAEAVTRLGENKVELNYTTKPGEENGSKTDEAFVATFSLDNVLEKVNADKAALAGAEFTLYDDAALTHEVDRYTTLADGDIEFKGLDGDKTYYLKETKAPRGFSLNDTVYTINFTNIVKDSTGKKVVSYDVEITYTDATGNVVKTTTIEYGSPATEFVDKVVNTQISSLPSTGGIGTTIFTIVGCGIMIAAAGLFFASRRKENR